MFQVHRFSEISFVVRHVMIICSVSVIVCFGLPLNIAKIDGNDGIEDVDNFIPQFEPVSGVNQDDFHLDSITQRNLNTKELNSTKNEFPKLKINITLGSKSQKVREASNSSYDNNITSYDVGLLFNTSQVVETILERMKTQNTTEDDDPEFAETEKENQENGGGNDNMITGLISAFLGGLSKPDGSIDIDAIVGLLGSLSTQNPDGSYDFQGLTDLLRGLFGGEGGSDVGAFLGGLLGALIKGVANPPGAKGAGILTGKIFGGLLPALSGPPDSDMMMPMGGNKPNLDVGGFLSGLLKTIASGSSGNMNNGMGTKTFIKTLLSAVWSIFAASSKKSDR